MHVYGNMVATHANMLSDSVFTRVCHDANRANMLQAWSLQAHNSLNTPFNQQSLRTGYRLYFDARNTKSVIY